MTSQRLRVLVSAYACEPGKGSEPAVGWGLATALSDHHDVWVITRANNESSITAALCGSDARSLNVLYVDLPLPVKLLKRAPGGLQLYYYLWQFAAFAKAWRAHQQHRFDIVHHVTFAKYWAPSLMVFLPVPFVWGPVGGGESTPRALRGTQPAWARLQDWTREAAQRLAALDPLVRLTARRSRIAYASTRESGERVSRLGAKAVTVLSQAAIDDEAVSQAGDVAQSAAKPCDAATFLCSGRLLYLKGFDLAIRSLAETRTRSITLRIIGDGPQRRHLEAVAHSCGLDRRVHFVGSVSHTQALAEVRGALALVHPSLHDSAGLVCIEALAAGVPVICLESGGPGQIVPRDAGFKIPVRSQAQVISDIAKAMDSLASHPQLREQLGNAGKEHVLRGYTWSSRARMHSRDYWRVLQDVSRRVG